jgi:hypothetical protein
MARRSKPGKIHLQIIEVMKRFPEGISGGQIRQELEKEGLEPGNQTHLDRRKRDLKKWFVIQKICAKIVVGDKSRKVTLYKYSGIRQRVVDQGQVSLKDRAEVIHGAHGRCQMCGKSVEQHGISLVVDHKKPRDWGGTNDRENLWRIISSLLSLAFGARRSTFGTPLRFLSRRKIRGLGRRRRTDSRRPCGSSGKFHTGTADKRRAFDSSHHAR